MATLKVLIPSPKSQRKPSQGQALQEIVSSAIAILGVVIQLWQTLTASTRPSDAVRLAQALYAPDSEFRLRSLAQESSGSALAPGIGAILTLLGLALLFYFKYQRAQYLDAKEDQISNPEGLRGCAHVLYAQLKFLLGIEKDDGSLRITVHRVTEDHDPQLEQVIDYVGTATPSGKERRFSISKGVIGLAARTGDAKIAERSSASDEEYKRELVDKWGYTPKEAEEVTLDRQTILAVPILDRTKRTLGVVLVDTNRSNAFDENTIKLITYAAVGFSTYIDERFR